MICQRTACRREIPEDAIFCPYCGKKQLQTPTRKPRKRANGSGTVYRDKRRGTWVAQARSFSGSIRVASIKRCGFRTRAEAEAWLQDYTSTGIAKQPIRFTEAWQALQDTQRYKSLSKDKQSHYRTAWARLEPIAMRQVGAVPFGELQKLVDAAPGDYYAHRDIKTLLGKLYELAATHEAISLDQDKTALLELPPVPESARDAFTDAEVQLMWLAHDTGDPFAKYALILCYTGMRPGELLDLDISNVDLTTQRIIGGIKTTAGRNREIPIASAIVPLVKEALQSATHGLADGCREHFYDQWCPTLARWGCRPHITAHSCRHTLAAAFERANASGAALIPPVLQKLILGHKIHDITEHYAQHFSFAEKLAAVEAATQLYTLPAQIAPTVAPSTKNNNDVS